MEPTGDKSRSALEQPGDKGGLGLHVSSADAPNLPRPDHRHRLAASQTSSRRSKAAGAEPGPDLAFQARWSWPTIAALTSIRASPATAVTAPLRRPPRHEVAAREQARDVVGPSVRVCYNKLGRAVRSRRSAIAVREEMRWRQEVELTKGQAAWVRG